MPDILIYTMQTCPYCVKAKALLQRKGVQSWKEIDVGEDEKLWAELEQKSNGRKTVPQIFIGSTHVGGFDDLDKLNREGKLDALLAG